MTAIERAVTMAGKQSDLAERCGVTQQCISTWVRDGFVKQPYIDIIFNAMNRKIPKSAFIADLHSLKKPRSVRHDKSNRAIINSITKLESLQTKSKITIKWIVSTMRGIPKLHRPNYKALIKYEKDLIDVRASTIVTLVDAVKAEQ